MDNKGYELIRRTVPGSSVTEPLDGEDLRFLTVGATERLSTTSSPGSVLNILEQCGLMDGGGRRGFAGEPRLRLLGQSAIRDDSGSVEHILTFEDLNSSRRGGVVKA